MIDDSNGLLVPACDAAALSAAMQQAWEAHWDYAAIARKSAHNFASTTHYNALLKLYK